MSKFTEFIASPNFLIIIILIIIVVCILLIRYQPGLSTKEESTGGLDPGYYDSPQNWSEITPTKISVKTENGINTGSLTNSDICSLYVYQNNFDINNKPNINTLYQDVYNDLAHFITTKTPVCLDSNEILAQHAEHTCLNKTKNSCINSFGNYVNEGTVEQFNVNCGSGVPPCSGVIGNISFNFLFTPEFSLENSTRFLKVDSLVTSSSVYKSLESEDGYYFQQGIFVEDTENTVKDNEYIPTFSNEQYINNSINQQFKFIRYTYAQAADSNLFNWSENALGPYVSIIFKPANAYLSARIINNNYQFIFYSLDNTNIEDTIQWFFMPSLDLNPQKVTTDTKISKGYVKQLSTDGNYGIKYDTDNLFIDTDTDNLFNINFNSSQLFEKYTPVAKGDIVKPYLNSDQDSTITIQWSWQGPDDSKSPQQQITLPDTEYPQFICKALTGGSVQDYTDFYPFTQLWTSDYPPGNNDINPAPLVLYFQSADDTSGAEKTSKSYNATLKTTLSFGQPINNTFNIGDVFYDNQVAWEVLDPFENIVVFGQDYFLNDHGLSIATNIGLSNKGTINYITPQKGLVEKINFDKIQYDYNEIPPGSYEVILNETNTVNPSIPLKDYNNDNPASIVLIFSPAQDTNGNNISALTEIDISNSGNGYVDKQQFGLSVNQTTFPGSSSNTPITNLSLNTNDQIVKLAAVALDTSDNVFNPTTDNLNQLKNSGLIIDQKNFTITNGSITLSDPYNIKSNDNGGTGYSIGDTIYFNELDQFNNSLLGETYSPLDFTADKNSLAQYKVNASSPPILGTSFPANHSLLREQGPSSGINLTKDFLFYNYWSTGKGEYAPSPPQVAFIGSGTSASGGLIENLKNIVRTGSSEEIISFLASDRDSGTKISNINYIKTIQFNTLNYIGIDSDILNETKADNNTLNPDEQPILGRFIPYSYFIPPAFKSGDPVDMPSGKSPTAFYNNNSAQIVPYGIKNIYKRIFNESDVPSI